MTTIEPGSTVAGSGDNLIPQGSPVPAPGGPRRRSFAPTTLRKTASSVGGAFGIFWLTVVVAVAVFAPLVAPHSPSAQDLSNTFSGFSSEHWLGTDDLGRDVLSRLIYGARVSLWVTVEVAALALLLAIPVGLIAGYVGGRTDMILMRVMDGGLSFPPLVLAMAVVSVLGPGVTNAAIALAIVFMPSLARLIRAQALAVREESFIEASRSLGSTPLRIITKRLFPNIASALIVQVAIIMSGALIAEAALSFLGLGAQPPSPSWGGMLQQAYATALFNSPVSLVIPGLAIAITVLAFNSLGDAMTSAFGLERGRKSAVRGAHRTRGRRGLTSVDRGPVTPAVPPLDKGVCLDVRGLTVAVEGPTELMPVVEDVNLVVRQGEILGLVGESGSGKTVTSMTIMRLNPSPPFVVTAGTVNLSGKDLLSLDFEEMRQVRGREVSMVFQDPMSSLNPAHTIGSQIAETIRLHSSANRPQSWEQAVKMLERVGIPDPSVRARSYPHQLSGGMRQRVMIAMALSCKPRLIIADEPTTALDVTVQAQILQLLRDLAREDDVAVIFVTHDLAVVSELCDRVVVMYAGQVVETAATAELFASPTHPYTAGLIGASGSVTEGRPARAIKGQVPRVGAMPTGCRFAPRCPFAVDACRERAQELSAVESASGRSSRCSRRNQLELEGV